MSLNRPLVCDVSVTCSNERAEKNLWNHTSSILFTFGFDIKIKRNSIFRLFLVVILTLLIFGTGYDLYVEQPLHEHLRRKAHKRQKSREFEGFTYEQIHQMTFEDYMDRPRCEFQTFSCETFVLAIFTTTLMMFSIPRNLNYIMDTKTEDGQIRCLHGARFLSM